MSRHEFTRATRRAAWERCGGRCEGVYFKEAIAPACGKLPDGDFNSLQPVRCNAPIDTGNFHYDHIDPDWFSGCNDLTNCQVLCVICHKEKTAKDQADIAKSKRVRDKRSKALVSKRPMIGSRKSGWKKTFNNGWERR